jgi:hypothetical protein
MTWWRGVIWCCLGWLLVTALACAARPAKPVGGPEPAASDGVTPHEVAHQGVRFRLGGLPFGWDALRKGDAVAAFQNRFHDQVIMVNQVYAPNRKANLTALRNHLLFDITDREITEHKKIEIDDREALWTVIDGRLDGARVKLAVAVVRIDAWVYDLVYIATPDRYDVCLPDFQAFIKAFHQKRAGAPEE